MAKTERVYVKTPMFRGSFCSLVEPRAMDGQDEDKAKYSIAIVLKMNKPSTKKFMKELYAAIDQATAAKWGTSVPRNKLKDFPIRKGSEVGDEGQFKGNWFMRASSKFKPKFVDKTGEPLDSEEELYSGAWYRVKVSVWCWEYKKRKGISLSLENGIKMKDDDKFGGGGGDPTKDFEDDIGEGDDDGGSSDKYL